MSPPQPRSIAQPGMTAAGHAAERDLDAYVRATALHVPLEFADRVMAAIEAETPTRRWFPVLASSERSRSRMAGAAAALMAALIGGGALVAGASGIIGRDVAMPASVGPASQPIRCMSPPIVRWGDGPRCAVRCPAKAGDPGLLRDRFGNVPRSGATAPRPHLSRCLADG